MCPNCKATPHRSWCPRGLDRRKQQDRRDVPRGGRRISDMYATQEEVARIGRQLREEDERRT